MITRFLLNIIPFLFLVFILLNSCVHEPVKPVGYIPPDTSGTGIPVDTSGGNNPCSPDTVYFQQDILPMLRSNCAKSGCHDEISAQKGVILTTYEKVIETGDIEALDPDNSKLYRKISETQPGDRMPPPPNLPLKPDQIDLIRTWILQGAKNLSCSDAATGCDTTQVTFSMTVNPILTTNCVGCHQGTGASGGVHLDSYTGVSTVVNNGRLWGAISHQDGFTAMPLNGNQLPECNLKQIKTWIDAGAPNN